MRIEKVEKYITEDGEEFFDLEDAKNHERDLIYENLHEYAKIDDMVIYKITNVLQLEALLNNSYGERTAGFKIEDVAYPTYICETMDDGCYYFYYRMLDDVITTFEKTLEQLKNVK